MNEIGHATMPRGLRDTQTWYLDVDPLKIVDTSLLDYIDKNGGSELLDLGCGLGGYAKLLASRDRRLIALDVNEHYVARAKQLGVDARHYDGVAIPLPDKSVDTIFMVEVLEHIAEPHRLLSELRRVARRNLIATVPNCGRAFNAPVVLNHMLDVDHKNFFTADSLRALLSAEFDPVQILEVAPVDATLAADLLPRWLFKFWRFARKRGLIEDRYYFRLIANAFVR